MVKKRLTLEPSPTASSGKDGQGRFTRGNGFGRGNPLASRVQALRVALVNAVSTDDLTAVVKRLVREARAGDTTAAKIIFERTLGTPMQADIVERQAELAERIEALEDMLRRR